MSNPREFNIIRRRPNLVDMLIPREIGRTYKLQKATACTGAWTDLAVVTNGYVEPSIDRAVLHSVPNRNTIRVVFDPDQHTLTDTSTFWLRLVTDAGLGTEEISPVAPVLPDSWYQGNQMFVFEGTAPATALHIYLPRSMKDVEVRNQDAAGSLYVAIHPSGSEVEVAPTTGWPILSLKEGPVTDLLVRGSVDFTVSCSNYLPL
jgi:hypothetical protein